MKYNNQPYSGNWKNVSEMEKQRLQEIYMEEKKKYRAKIDEVFGTWVCPLSILKNYSILAARGGYQKS